MEYKKDGEIIFLEDARKKKKDESVLMGVMEDDSVRVFEFDLEDGNGYFELIRAFSNDPYFTEEGLGDPRGMDWDIDFLRTIIKTIVRDHHEELLAHDKEYSPIDITANLISNAMAYALVNNRDQVGKTELLNTFKTWTYMPFNMSLSVLETLFEEQNIDYKEHPFGIKKKKTQNKQYKKVIEFPKKYQEE